MADDHRLRDLYDRDFYLWTQGQAEALRQRGKAMSAIEWDRVAEELEDMGKSERRECFSRTSTIIEHLFKLAWSQRTEPRGGWRATIRTQRRELDLTLTATLRAQLDDDLEHLHVEAALIASDTFDSEEPSTLRDATLRWTLPQIFGEAGDPIA